MIYCWKPNSQRQAPGNALALWNPPSVVRIAESHGAHCCGGYARTEGTQLGTVLRDHLLVAGDDALALTDRAEHELALDA